MEEKLLTIAQAAELTGVAKSTITRARARGEFPRAQQKEGTWFIPVTDLIASGRIDTVTKKAPDADGDAASTKNTHELEHALEIEHLRRVHTEELLHQAQQLIAAKTETISALQRSLETAKKPQQAVPAPENTSTTETSAEKASPRTTQRHSPIQGAINALSGLFK